MFETNLIASLPASDMARAKAFYRDKLDLKPADESAEGAARYECGDSWFMLYHSEFAGSNQATAAAWEVDDVTGTVAALRERGVTFEDYDFGEVKTVDGIAAAPDGTKAAWFRDSEGNILGIFEPA